MLFILHIALVVIGYRFSGVLQWIVLSQCFKLPAGLILRIIVVTYIGFLMILDIGHLYWIIVVKE